MYVYEMSYPIDTFGLMVNFKEYYKKCANSKLDHDVMTEAMSCTDSLRSFLKVCLRSLAVMQCYWEGDVRGDALYIGSIPNAEEVSSDYFIALKQDNNGSSYMVSQIPFVHLDEFLLIEKIGKPVSEAMQDSIKNIVDEFAPKVIYAAT